MALNPIEALNRLRQLGLSFAISQAFFAACNMGIFDLLLDGSATAEDLGKKLHINPEGCRRLLVVLHRLGLLEREGARFRNSELGRLLTAESPYPMHGYAKIQAIQLPHTWEFLPDALRQYGPVWQQALGATSQEVFAALYEDPEQLRRFCDYMNVYAVPIGQEIAERYDFTPHRCVLDVAGGTGQLSQQIALRHPHLKGIVMDLPPVLKVAAEEIAANGLAGRFRTESADLFTGPYPSGADVITLSWIIHDWNDDNCRKILAQCFDALPSGGVVLISETVMHNDFSGKTLWAELFSLMMLIACEPGARERTESEHQALLDAAGFQDVEFIHSEGPRDLIVARKP